ncbi:MAG: hypothetical protein K9M11_00150 [Candidatus Pacebacteria bacterium]|nr:hypothetical protein [Candidatus Paceibacterota bacterium]
MFSAYAAVLASYCQDKWRIADYPYATIPMTGLVASEDPGDEPRMEFLRGLMPPPSMETQCLVLVVSEAQSLVMPNALCQLAGFPQRYDEFKNGVLSPYRFLSVTVDMQTGGVSFVKNEKADW